MNTRMFPADVLSPEPRQVRLTVDDYLLLDASDALDAHGKTELIEGVILAMNARHRPHARIRSDLSYRLMRALEDMPGLSVLIEASVAMPLSDAPISDIVLTTEPEGCGLVPLQSVRLLVEVADTSLSFDAGRKTAIYAANGIPEYSIVDVQGELIRQLWQPENAAYARSRDAPFGGHAVSATIEGLTIDTGGL